MLNRLKKLIIPLTIAIFLFAPVTPFLSFDDGVSAGFENNVTYAQEGSINAGNEPANESQCGGLSVFSWSCIVDRIIQIFVYPAMWILSIVARLFDYVVGFSISSMAYGKGVPIILEGWSIVRDFTNIIFVFGLLIIAFSYITNSFNVNQKKALVTLVSIAIIANFSLFLARVIIDAGNLTARVFYQNIEASTVVKENGAETLTYTTISEAVAERMSFQRFLATDLYKNVTTNQGTSTLTRELNSSEASLRLVVAAVLWLAIIVLIYVFGSMMFIFIGRIVELWLAMILSPLAIASVAMPKIGRFSFGEYDFGVWLNKLISNSFMAPVFLFFVYLVAIFLELPLFKSIPADLNFGMKIVHIVFPILIVAYILILAKKISMKMATGLAKQVSSGIESTVGLAANLAITKGAGLARKLGGAAGSRLATAGARITESQEGKTGLKARLTRSAGTSIFTSGRKLKTSTFDPRSLKLGAIPTALGDKPTMNIGQAAKGGYEADLRKKEKKRVERAKLMGEALRGKVAKDARDEADNIEGKIKDLNNIRDVKFYNQKAQEVNDKIKKTTEELKELRAQGGKYIDPEKIERLEQEIENLRAEKKEREADISEYRTELAATLKSTEAEAKWNELIKGDGTEKNPGLYSLLKANRESLDKSKAELEKAENTFQENEAQIKVKENQIAALNAAPPSEENKTRIEELTKEKKALEDIQAEFTKAGGIRETKKGEIDTANKNIGDLKTKITQNEGELKTIMNSDKSAGIVTKDDFTTFQKRLDDAKKAENQSDKLSRTMSIKESEKEDLESQSKKELNQKLAATQNKINNFQGDLSAINKAKGEVKTKDEDGKEVTVNELLKKHKTRLGELKREIQTTEEQVLEDLAGDAEKHWGEMVDSIFDYTAKGATSLAKRVGVSDKNAKRLGKATRTTLGVINSPTRMFNEGASELRTKKANAIRELKPKK